MPDPRSFALVAVLLAAASPAPSARAEGPGSNAPKGGVFPTVAEVKDEEAKKMLAELDKAFQSGDENSVTQALRPMVTKRHATLVARLKPLADDRRPGVAALAVEALGSQGDASVAGMLARVMSEPPTKEEKKRGFLLRGMVRAAAVEALGRLGVKGCAKAVRDLGEEMILKDALRSYATAILRAAVRYCGLLKDKESVSFLIDLVDEPIPANPTSPTNPPAEYWKARNDTWRAIRMEVQWALKEITGQSFENKRRWDDWMEGDGKRAGMK